MRAVLVLFALVPLLACSTGSDEGEPAPAGAGTAAAEPAEVHWGYDEAAGPDRWADLSPDFALCRDGKEQSPVDLTSATVLAEEQVTRGVGDEVLTFEQRASVLGLIDNGHTIQVTSNASVTLEIDGEVFDLVQYHFHAPSEHTIDGEHGPLELHFVHQAPSGGLAVIGVLAEEGEHEPALDEVIAALPSGPGEERHLEGLEVPMDRLEMLSARYYRYEGSLTTPPCTEGVHWIVMAERRQMSAEQITELSSRLHSNNRPVQPLGVRELVLVQKR